MNFQKIGKNARGDVVLRYTSDAHDVDRTDRTCSDLPLESFNAALQDLAWDLLEICLLDSLESFIVEIRDVRIVEHDVLGLGVRIRGVREIFSGRVREIITPVIYAHGKDSLTDKTVRKIETLEREAAKYVRGERLQGTLAFKKGVAAA